MLGRLHVSANSHLVVYNTVILFKYVILATQPILDQLSSQAYLWLLVFGRLRVVFWASKEAQVALHSSNSAKATVNLTPGQCLANLSTAMHTYITTSNVGITSSNLFSLKDRSRNSYIIQLVWFGICLSIVFFRYASCWWTNTFVSTDLIRIRPSFNPLQIKYPARNIILMMLTTFRRSWLEHKKRRAQINANGQKDRLLVMAEAYPRVVS